MGAVLSRAQQRPQVLDWARSRTTDIESITAAELNVLASRYLSQARASHIVVLPAPKA